MFVLHSALAPNGGEYECAFSFIIAQMIFFSKPPSWGKIKCRDQHRDTEKSELLVETRDQAERREQVKRTKPGVSLLFFLHEEDI